MTDTMTISLIRHGSTAGNLAHRYVGRTDEPLTEEAARTLKENRESYPRADFVFTSPMKRCVQTAELLYPEAERRILPEFTEIDFGAFENKNYEELKNDPRYQAWIDSGGTMPFPDGEGMEAFCARSCAAFLEACEEVLRAAWEKGPPREAAGGISAAFVVHGGTIMSILGRYSDPNRDYFQWQVKNAEGFSCVLSLEDGTLQGKIRLCEIAPLPEAPALTGIQSQVIRKGQKDLRCGYTTGSCAAAAAKAAAQMLLGGRLVTRADVLTPKGIRLHLPVCKQEITEQYASAAVKKYAGDDPDCTDGVLVYARVEYTKGSRETPDDSSLPKERLLLKGGAGVGRVTKPGLEQPVGEAAINRVPRKMILQEVAALCEEAECTASLTITISVPGGEEIAKKTFNPHLGIEGGISILGTSGLVLPMSEEALIESIRVEMRQKIASGETYLLITPGNYGEAFLRREGTDRSLALCAEDSMKCSNYVGETLEIAESLGVRGILFVAHIGKFIKVSGGIMNTHSAQADCRAELIAAQAMRAGVPAETVRRLLDVNTTEEAVALLLEQNCLDQTMAVVTERVKFHLQKHCKGALETEAILFSNRYGYLGETDGADALVQKLAEQNRQKDQSR